MRWWPLLLPPKYCETSDSKSIQAKEYINIIQNLCMPVGAWMTQWSGLQVPPWELVTFLAWFTVWGLPSDHGYTSSIFPTNFVAKTA